jgi:hypothetical protein
MTTKSARKRIFEAVLPDNSTEFDNTFSEDDALYSDADYSIFVKHVVKIKTNR